MKTCIVVGACVATLLVAGDARGQVPSPAPASGPARAAAPVDVTGNWVSIVNEDWRWRMVTPPRGDFPGIPLSPAGVEAAMAWDPDTDGSCLAYGAAGLLRMPTRLRISWDDDDTLRLETDNGAQTRLLHFGAAEGSGAPSLQGHSVAGWRFTLPASNPFGIAAPGAPPAAPGGGLDVETTNLEAAWLRRNGVPYSAETIMTEHFDRFPGPDGSDWLIVTTIVRDPVYLAGPFITSSQFRLEADGSNWSPAPCLEP